MTKVEKVARKVLKEHTEQAFCCYSDRGPCVLDGIPEDQREFQCSAPTCSVCAPSPYRGRTPLWPCQPVILARAVLGQ